MPRPKPVITAVTAPLEVLDDQDALHYVRATELLRLARSRRDARLLAEAKEQAKEKAPLQLHEGCKEQIKELVH